MKTNNNWEVFFTISKLNSRMSRKLDASLGGLGWNDFMVLYFLDNAPQKQMRRIDLAEKIGLSASGVTRLLLPMEKIGLIKKEANKSDARVSLVSITQGGKNYLTEAITNLDRLTEEVITDDLGIDIKNLEKDLIKLYKNF